ncbi:5'-deoxyadenosine deaminase [Paenibacillus sp. 1P07SE]|uniref:5'-deoxyadenosine deaminase n=1 Tax=Paenibacillus sp. 1P07SE TaxID=3132209 RepID=UPI0039A74BCD
MNSILFKQAQIVTMDAAGTVFKGDVLVQGDRIAEMAPTIEAYADDVIDASGKVMLPGFVQTHIHLCQTLFRGRADDMELLDWLRERIWPLEAAHDEESVYHSAMLGIGELIRSGTTTILDMETVHHTESAFRAIEQSGIRAIAGKVMMDHGTHVPRQLQERTEQSLQQSVDLLEAWHGKDNGRIQYAFSPRFVVSCTEELLVGVRDLSRQYNVKIHTHAAENRGEIELIERERGMRNVVYLDHLGLASPDLILAHCVWLDEAEKEIIRTRGVKVTHCPGSNLKLASGIAEVPDLRSRQIPVGIGADGAPCNNTLDMFQEMRLTALIQKTVHGPTAMDARSVLRMATIGGAEVLGLEEKIGSIESGKQADLILLDLDEFHAYPSFEVDPYSRIVYSAGYSDVDTVMIDGRLVMRGKRLLTMDKSKVLREADRAIRRLVRG